jgi:hypothetical protein
MVDMDGPGHEANDPPGITMPVENHRGRGPGGPTTQHNDPVDND